MRVTTFNGRELEVVGVSADYKVSTVGEVATPYIHYAIAQRPASGEEIIARTPGDFSAALVSTAFTFACGCGEVIIRA